MRRVFVTVVVAVVCVVFACRVAIARAWPGGTVAVGFDLALGVEQSCALASSLSMVLMPNRLTTQALSPPRSSSQTRSPEAVIVNGRCRQAAPARCRRWPSADSRDRCAVTSLPLRDDDCGIAGYGQPVACASRQVHTRRSSRSVRSWSVRRMSTCRRHPATHKEHRRRAPATRHRSGWGLSCEIDVAAADPTQDAGLCRRRRRHVRRRLSFGVEALRSSHGGLRLVDVDVRGLRRQ